MKNAFSDEGLREPTYHKQPPHHPFRPAHGGRVDDACAVIALPCPFDMPGRAAPWKRGSLGWKQMDPTFQHSSSFAAALHLLTMAPELTGYGTPIFKGVPGSTSVRDSQMAYIRALEGRPRKGDDKLLRSDIPGSGIVHEIRFDPAVADVMHAIASGHFDQRIGRDRGLGQDDDEDLVDGMAVDLGHQDVPRGGGGGRRRGRGDESDDEEDDDPYAEMDRRILEILDENLQGHEGRHIEEKMKIVVTALTRPALDDEGKPTGKDEPAGCIIFFCIMDPLYSLGKVIDRLISLCEEHRSMRLGIKDSAKLFSGDQTGERFNHYRGGRGRDQRTSRLMEIFPWLGTDDHRSNAMHNLDRAAYLHLAAFVQNKPDLVTGTQRQRALTRGMAHPGTATDPNPLHPVNMFTPAWACQVMQQFGVPASRCSVPFFQGRLDVHGIGSDDDEDDQDLEAMLRNMASEDQPLRARWFFPPESSYHYLMEAWTWYRNGYAGLFYQYFPWVEVPAPLIAFTSVRDNSNAVTRYEGDSDRNVLSKEYTRMLVSSDVGIVVPLPVMPYDPNAIMRHNAIHQVATENQRIFDDIKAPRDPKSDPQGYLAFCHEMRDYREACMMRMQQVLVTTAHIPAAMKVILTWAGQKMRRAGCHLPMYTMDPGNPAPETLEMDAFANFMIREAVDVRYHRHVAGETRYWQICHWGAMDAYSTTRVDMHVGVIFYGKSQTGKSFIQKDATVKTTIEGTVSTMLESSNRAFNTHDDFMYVIMFKDELENIYVDSKAAEADKSGRAERIKSMLTDHKTTYRVLTFVEAANGRQKREAEDIESLFHATMFCCTNKKVNSGDEAIASRFLNFVMTRHDCDLFEYLGIKQKLDEDDVKYNADIVHSWRVKQVLLALAQSLIDGGVLPEPSMDAYDLIISRILAYIKKQGIETGEIRNAHICRRLARIYTILNALILTYDVPGARLRKHEFELVQLAALTPHLYCTKQIAFFAISQTFEIYMHPGRNAVVMAAMRMASFKYVKNYRLEDYFRADTQKTYPWRVIDRGEDGHTVDCTYFSVSGKYKEVIIKGIAEHSLPKRGENEVAGDLEDLTGVFITTRPARPLAMSAYKALQPSQIACFSLMREEHERRIPVVIRDFKNSCIHVAVEALNHFHPDLLLDAIGYCIHDQFRPQEFLLGTTVEKPSPVRPDEIQDYPGIYRTLCISPDVVDELSVGESLDSPDVSYMPPTIVKMLSGKSRNPDKAASKQRYAASRVKRTRVYTSIEQDIDDWAYELHHYRSAVPGNPQHSPATQQAVYNSIRAAMLKKERRMQARAIDGPRLGDSMSASSDGTPSRALFLDYPLELIAAEDHRLVEAEKARSFRPVAKRREQRFQDRLKAWKALPPLERARVPQPRVASLGSLADKLRSQSNGSAALPSLVDHSQLNERARSRLEPRQDAPAGLLKRSRTADLDAEVANDGFVVASQPQKQKASRGPRTQMVQSAETLERSLSAGAWADDDGLQL